MTTTIDRRAIVALLAVLACLTVGFAGAVPSGADAAGQGTAQAAKKKCGKKGKKRAAAAKKCKKRRGGGAPAPTTAGPELPIGSWYCPYGSFQTQAGNLYTVNNGNQGSYTYNPTYGIVNFQGGSYASFFGKYYPDRKALELYAAFTEGSVDYGDYAWTCSFSG